MGLTSAELSVQLNSKWSPIPSSLGTPVDLKGIERSRQYGSYFLGLLMGFACWMESPPYWLQRSVPFRSGKGACGEGLGVDLQPPLHSHQCSGPTPETHVGLALLPCNPRLWMKTVKNNLHYRRHLMCAVKSLSSATWTLNMIYLCCYVECSFK